MLGRAESSFYVLSYTRLTQTILMKSHFLAITRVLALLRVVTLITHSQRITTT